MHHKLMKVMSTIISILVIGISCTLISINHAWAQDYYNVPSWTKEISDFWSHGQLSDIESVNAFQYLMDEKIIVVPSVIFDKTTTFDKKIELTKTLSDFLWSESPQSTDVKPITTAQQSITDFIYVQPIPPGTQFTSDQILKSTNYWSERTGTKFSVTSDPNMASTKITWLMEPHLEYSGYTVGKTAEVAIGDSKCDNTWHAYDTDFISSTLTHELGHSLGFGHSSNPSDIMYPTIPNAKYAPIVKTLTLGSGESAFIHTCTFWQKGTFHYNVNSGSDAPLKIFFVPSKMEFNKFLNGQKFDYYTNDGCFDSQNNSYDNTCENVSKDGGLFISASNNQTSQKIIVTLNEE
jgi:Matrixin